MLALLLALSIAISGCSNNEKINTIDENDAKVEFSEQNTQNSEPTKRVEYEKYQGRKIDFGQVVKPEDFFGKDKYEKDEDEPDEEVTSWENHKGDYLLVEPGRIYYRAKEHTYNYDSLLWDKEGKLRQDFDKRTKNVESVAGITEEEAAKRIREIVEKYGISGGNIKAFPLDAEVLKKLSQDFMSDEEYKEYMKDSVVCESCDVTYIAVGNKDSFEFVPTYVFGVKCPIKNPDNENEKIYTTQKYLLDAENGKWVE